MTTRIVVIFWTKAVALSKSHGGRFAKFVAIGLFNTAFGYSIYLLGLWLGLSPTSALATATVLGALFNYFTTGRLVFGERGAATLPRFLLAYTAIFAFNAALLHLILSAGVAAWLAQALALPVVVLVTYAVMNFWVFRNPR